VRVIFEFWPVPEKGQVNAGIPRSPAITLRLAPGQVWDWRDDLRGWTESKMHNADGLAVHLAVGSAPAFH